MYAQGQEQDVVVLRNNTIIRGTLTQPVSPGSAVMIMKANGKVSALLWSEIRTIRRLPENMPDSGIVALYPQTGPGGRVSEGASVSRAGGPSSRAGMDSRDTTEEDVLILTRGNIVRGDIVESSQKGTVGLWTPDQRLTVYRDAEVQKKLHLAKGMTDSTIDVMYIHPLPEMIAEDFRILTIFGGFSSATGGFESPPNDGGDPAGSGWGIGLHVSVRVFPYIRWATTAIYGKNTMGLPWFFGQYAAEGSPAPHRLTWIVTGGEIRSEGTSALKVFGFLQGGILFSRITGFEVTIPVDAKHPSTLGRQEGASSTSGALVFGAGVSMGRFSLTGRLLTSTATYSYSSTADFGPGYGGGTTVFKSDQPVSIVQFSLGFSPF